MTEFLASISWLGWGLIALALLTLWQLPRIIRAALTGADTVRQDRPHPGEDPPHLNPGAPHMGPPTSGEGDR